MIYVIGESRTGVVKIGTAGDPWRRLGELQVGNPHRLCVQLTLPGGQDGESYLHREFAARRLHGEWFDFGEDDAVIAVATASVAGADAETASASTRQRQRNRPPARDPRNTTASARTRRPERNRPPTRDPRNTLSVVLRTFAQAGEPRLPTRHILAQLAEHDTASEWGAMPSRSAAMALAADLYTCTPGCRPVTYWDSQTRKAVQGYRLAELQAS